MHTRFIVLQSSAKVNLFHVLKMPFIPEYKQRQLRQLAQKEETCLTVQYFAYAVVLLLSLVALQHVFKCCRRVMLRSK